MSIKWKNLRVCGMPVVPDPTQETDGELVVNDGGLLIIDLVWKDDVVIGATGHVEPPAAPDTPPDA